MYENDAPPEKHPFRFAFALLAALMVNSAMGAVMMHSGVDERLRREGLTPQLVANLGALPVVAKLPAAEDKGCRKSA